MYSYKNRSGVLWRNTLLNALLLVVGFVLGVQVQGAQPIVAIHDSELTRALETMPASGGTPTGGGTTGNQWWITQWHYFVMPDSVKEMLRSDGTTFTVVGDSNIVSGVLTNVDGSPKYPILISLASEAIQDSEIAPLTNYVAAGGFLFVGSSAFTRNPDGSTRANFALATAMGVNMVNPGLTNWGLNTTFTKLANQLLVSHFPEGTLYWQMPSWADETTVPQNSLLTGTTPDETPPIILSYMAWQVQAGDAVAIAEGDVYSNLFVKPFGKGYFIYYAPLEPLIGHGGWAPSTYAYSIFRNAIEWAFQSANVPVVKVSPWPYPYQAAVIFRHDLEAIPSLINSVESSAQFENQNGAKGEYYFCTGTLREDYSPTGQTNAIASLKRAITNYGATISSHNGGLTNINIYVPPLPIIELLFGSDPDWYTSGNPYYDTSYGFIPADYSYWHWGPDEVLDLTNLPPGFTSGAQYALTSISNSFSDLAGWGLTNGNSLRTWVSPDFDATREPSYQIEQQLGIKTTGEEKLGPFPSWVLSTETNDYRYSFITLPTSDWFIDTQIGQSMETGQTVFSVQKVVDYFYNLGALINLYGHSSSAGNAGGARLQEMEYLTYAMNSQLHPRLWAANSQDIYAWWLQRSNVQITATTFSTNAGQSQVTIIVSGATDTNTAVEILAPSVSFTVDQVLTNGVPASNNVYWINGQVIKLLVGNSVTNATINYTLLPVVTNALYSAQESVPLTVAAPGVLTGANAGQNGGNLTATAVGGPMHGALSFNSNGSFTYTPSNNFVGFDSFTFQATAGSLTSSVATATIDVNPSGALFYDNFMRPSGSSNSITPWIVEVGTWTMTNGLMQGTCDAGPGGYGGAYIDNPGWTDYVAQAQIQFSAANANLAGLGGRLDPVSGAHYAAWVYPEGSSGGSDKIQLIKFTGWTDPNTLTGFQQVLGQANLSSVGTSWHTVTLAFHGTNIDVYFDNQLKISTNDPVSPLTSGGIIMDMMPYPSTFTLGVSNVIVTTLPVAANNDSYSVFENTSLVVGSPGVLGNDVGTGLTAVLVSGPTDGVLTLNSDGSFTYTPNSGYIGADSFAYQASNGQTNSNIATVSLNITPFLASNDSYSVAANTILSVGAPGVLGNDTSGGESLTAVLVSVPTNGVLTLNANGSFSYTPNNGYIGADSFTYQANNGQTNSNIATVSLAVTPDPPTANNDFYTMAESSFLTVGAPGVLANDSGGSGTLTATLAAGPANGTLTLNTNGSFNYTPGSNFTGIDSFTYQATDGQTTSSVAMVTIMVTPTGDLFYDNFTRSLNNSNSLLPWVVYDGTWEITGGILTGQSADGTYGNIYINNTNWTDYSVQAQIQFSTTAAWGGGIGGRLDPTTGAHYAAWIYPDGSGGGPNVLKLFKFSDWADYTLMQTASLPAVGTGPHTLTLTLQGTNISVSLDGTLEISTDDSSPFTNGGITVDMATIGTPYTFGVDNVIVTSLLPGQTINFGPLSNMTYGNSPFTVSATASSGLPVSLDILSGPATISGNTITIAGTGTVTVQASQAGNASYQAATNVYQTFTVLPANVTITSGITANNKPYDGTVLATISSNNVVLNGVLGVDTANVRLSTNGYVANFVSTNAGTGIGVTVAGLALTGTAAANYTLTQPAGLTANITAKALTIMSVPSPVITSLGLTNGVVTITWNSVAGGNYRVQYINNLNDSGWNDLSPDVTATGLTASQTNVVNGVPQRFYRIKVLNPGITANNKMYDGTTAATISSNNVVLAGVVDGDTVGLSTNGYAANFASPNVGTGIVVTVSGLALIGVSAANYTLTQPVGLTANITPATLTVTADNKSMTYGLPNPLLTASYSGFVHSDGTNVLTGAANLSTSATTNSPPGSYAITVGPGTLNAANYVFVFNGGTLTVAALPQLSGVALTGNQFIFNLPTIAGQTYQLQYKDNLTAATWTLLGGSMVGTGSSIIITNDLGASPQRFFRLVISP